MTQISTANAQSSLFHEQLYRSPETMEKFRDCAVVVCGAGALGANVVEGLARSGFGRLKVIDRDRIEARNLSTQPYYRSDVGAFKTKILANSLYRALGIQIEAKNKELTAANVKQLLGKPALAIDAFDNSIARQVVKDYCIAAKIPCLHAGLSSDYGEIIWNDAYRVPSATNDDICDYPLARNLVMLTATVACESLITFIATGQQHSFTVTLRDLTIRPFQ